MALRREGEHERRIEPKLRMFANATSTNAVAQVIEEGRMAVMSPNYLAHARAAFAEMEPPRVPGLICLRASL